MQANKEQGAGEDQAYVYRCRVDTSGRLRVQRVPFSYGIGYRRFEAQGIRIGGRVACLIQDNYDLGSAGFAYPETGIRSKDEVPAWLLHAGNPSEDRRSFSCNRIFPLDGNRLRIFKAFDSAAVIADFRTRTVTPEPP